MTTHVLPLGVLAAMVARTGQDDAGRIDEAKGGVKSKRRNTATDVRRPKPPAMKSLSPLFPFIVLATVLGPRLPL
jgi:hypothetical protein